MSMLILSKKEARNVCGGFNLGQELRNFAGDVADRAYDIKKGWKDAWDKRVEKEKSTELSAAPSQEKKDIIESCFSQCSATVSPANQSDEWLFDKCISVCKIDNGKVL